MLALSNYVLKQQDRFNISVFIFYIFKWFYAFNKKEMSYEERVCRMMMMLMMQKNSNNTFCVKYINNNNNNNNKFMEQFRVRKIYRFVIEY